MREYLFVVTGVLVCTLSSPSLAHKIEVQGDIGATLHIEPDDLPKAGVPSDVWFALTQAGGTIVPLEACECSLTLYDGGGTAIATPGLQPVSAEGFADIPGASVTFPEVGAYELALAGEPSDGGQFAPFELRFEVTVAARAADAALPESTATSPESPSDEEIAATDVSVEPATDSLTDAETPVAVETPRQPESSFPWRVTALLGGAVLLVGVLWGIVGVKRSPGGKS